jgi:hypothetical protein
MTKVWVAIKFVESRKGILRESVLAELKLLQFVEILKRHLYLLIWSSFKSSVQNYLHLFRVKLVLNNCVNYHETLLVFPSLEALTAYFSYFGVYFGQIWLSLPKDIKKLVIVSLHVHHHPLFYSPLLYFIINFILVLKYGIYLVLLHLRSFVNI